MQAYISGNPILVTSQVPISLRAGLPTIIPGPLRSLIRSGDLITCRAILSVFAVYRVIKIPGTMKLETITDTFKGQEASGNIFEIKSSLRELIQPFGEFKLKPIKLILLGAAGPNHPVSMLGI